VKYGIKILFIEKIFILSQGNDFLDTNKKNNQKNRLEFFRMQEQNLPINK